MDLPQEAATQTDDTITTCDVTDNTHSDHDGDEEQARGNWGSQVQYLLTVVGYCVGLSNVLRFPYICKTNGGGAFLIPYITCLLLCGLPLFFLEVVIGQFHGKGAAHVWGVCPLIKGLGIGMLIISGGVIVYYSTTCAWAVYYTIYSCRTVLPWTSCDNTWNTENCVENMKLMTANSFTVPNETRVNKSLAVTTNYAGNSLENETLFHTAAEEFWQYKVLSITSGMEHLGGIKWELALCLLVTWILIFSSLAKGIKSIGKVVYVTATMPYVFLFILLVRGLTLPGGPQGVLFFITPDFNKLLDVQVWVTACVQVFFSLGPGYGGLISMASYNNFHSNCLR
ncbi:sodium- and chloride-dependent glycine transporter 2-like [Haliotis rubra]|uniref:sodium- and chloride-dependent glycine transporter 2-like n=1 Tax=Haliotis rubra TaxID=36100 RepID=UPI001EE557A2|nr:sodium- and chloride-dependent glycine transporter 2-like [Haliotis rubra]